MRSSSEVDGSRSSLTSVIRGRIIRWAPRRSAWISEVPQQKGEIK